MTPSDPREPPASEGLAFPEAPSADTTKSAVDRRRGNLTMAFLGTFMMNIIIIDVAAALPRRSAAYEWANRFGIFLGLILVFGFSVILMSATFRRWDAPRSTAWIARIGALVIPLIFIFKLLGRILDAFWLR